MKEVMLFFKKDRMERTAISNVKKDLLGTVSSIIFLSIIYALFIYVFDRFASIYIGVDFGDSQNQISRVYELFVVSLSVVFIINVIREIKKIDEILTNEKEFETLICCPINMGAVFVYKLLKIYLMQTIETLVVASPIFVVLDYNFNNIGGIKYYVLMIFIIALMPLISCAVSTLLALPYTYITKRIKQRFVAKLFIYVVLIGVMFYLYGFFLDILSRLIRSGDIKYIFDFGNIKFISRLCYYLYPGKLLTNILFSQKMSLSLLMVIAFSLLGVLGASFIVKKIYLANMQEKLEGINFLYKQNYKCKSKSRVATLISKEYRVVLRTPSYAFQYFAMSISMPFMVYVCSSLLESMLETITFLDCNYSIAIFVTSMFSVLSNSFSTTNISRDGLMFSLMKTMPITIRKMVNAKVIFSSMVSFVSVFLSSIVLYLVGFLNLKYSVVTFLIGFIFSLIQIFIFTRKDMENPIFANNDNQEVVWGNKNTSILILLSLIFTAFISGGGFLVSLVLSMKYNGHIGSVISIGFMFSILGLILFCSRGYLYKDLEK